MLRRLSARMIPITSRAADYAPMAPACCNVCRTCTTTNIVGLMIGGATFAALGAARLANRTAKRA